MPRFFQLSLSCSDIPMSGLAILYIVLSSNWQDNSMPSLSLSCKSLSMANDFSLSNTPSTLKLFMAAQLIAFVYT